MLMHGDGVRTDQRVADRRAAGKSSGVRRDDLLAAVIAHRQIAVAFQPQINPITGEVTGAEALARWDRVATAEQLFARASVAGLSERLSRLVQSKALRAASAWEGPLRRLFRALRAISGGHSPSMRCRRAWA